MEKSMEMPRNGRMEKEGGEGGEGGEGWERKRKENPRRENLDGKERIL